MFKSIKDLVVTYVLLVGLADFVATLLFHHNNISANLLGMTSHISKDYDHGVRLHYNHSFVQKGFDFEKDLDEISR